jgi:hypothetical protein
MSKLDYQNLYERKCDQYRADMNLRNTQINKANEKINSLELNVDNLHKIIKRQSEKIQVLKSWFVRTGFLAAVFALISALACIGINNA